MSRLQTNAIRHLGSAVDNLTLDNAGRVLMPNQPAFRARIGSNWSTINSFVKFEKTLSNTFDRLGNYNASTGLFTAPVAGAYLFEVDGFTGTASDTYYQFQINGNMVSEVISYPGGYGSYHQLASTVVLNLSANDAIGIYWKAGSAYGTPAGGQGLAFSGHLIG